MTIKEEMRERHSVRKYTDKKIPADIAAQLNDRIAANNSENKLDMKLILGNEKVVKWLANLTFIKGAVSFIILAGKDSPDLDEKFGYCGTDVILYAQTLGLNSVWLGGTYNKKRSAPLRRNPCGRKNDRDNRSRLRRNARSSPQIEIRGQYSLLQRRSTRMV